MKRVQLSLLLEPEPEREIEESVAEEPPIGLYGNHAVLTAVSGYSHGHYVSVKI